MKGAWLRGQPNQNSYVSLKSESVPFWQRVAGVAHVPCISGSGVCVCVYFYKMVWLRMCIIVQTGYVPTYQTEASQAGGQ
jgi:hypothetical protein